MKDETGRIDEADRTDIIAGVHKLPLFGALAVGALAVFVVAGAQLSDTGKVERTIGKAVAERHLVFRDAPDGNIIVRDAMTHELLGKYGRGEGAFIRQSMRAMTHARRQHGKAQGQPYQLVKTESGKLSIVDPVTGTFIKLNAFGSVAITSFSKFLPTGENDQTSQDAQQQKQKGA